MHFVTAGPSLEQLEERSHHNHWNGALWPKSMSTYGSRLRIIPFWVLLPARLYRC